MERKEVVKALLQATNAFNIEKALSYFADEASIRDESVGASFQGLIGVRRYLSQYFLEYHTRTVLLSLEVGQQHVVTQVDFTGDFGHETGSLKFQFDGNGKITVIEAHLD